MYNILEILAIRYYAIVNAIGITITIADAMCSSKSWRNMSENGTKLWKYIENTHTQRCKQQKHPHFSFVFLFVSFFFVLVFVSLKSSNKTKNNGKTTTATTKKNTQSKKQTNEKKKKKRKRKSKRQKKSQPHSFRIVACCCELYYLPL